MGFFHAILHLLLYKESKISLTPHRCLLWC